MLKQAFRSIAVMLKYARFSTVSDMLIRLALSLEAPVGIFFMSKLVNSIGSYINKSGELSEVIEWAAFLLALTLLSAASGMLLRFLNITTEKALSRSFMKVVLEKFRNLEYACYEDREVLNSLERMGSEPHLRIYSLFLNTVSALSVLISLVGTAVLFARISIWFAVVYFVLLVPMLWFDYKYVEKLQRLWNTEMPNWRRRTYLSALLADKNAVFELKLFGASGFILKKWKTIADTFRREYLYTKLRSCKYGIFRDLSLAAWAVFFMLSMILRLSGGTVDIGTFVACITSMGTILGLSASMSDGFSQVSQNCIEMKHFDIFMSLPEIKREDYISPIGSPSVKFENVFFTYPKTNKPVLRGVSFEISPGERIALVGENGAGKSTIVKLLCGLYKPDSGDILINGVSIKDLSHTQLRSVFSVVFQDFCSYELKLRENVAFGNISKLDDDEAIITALKSGLWEENIPLDANLGKLEEDGIDLSGGQWQKIAVARSLLSDCSFIILDEPTAALDPLAESRMYETFQSVLKNRGCIMISHRLASAKLADKIVVLDDGSVTGCGTHESLMASDGLYSRMFTAQSAWYKEGGAEYAEI